jgi:hypothetical protein
MDYTTTIAVDPSPCGNKIELFGEILNSPDSPIVYVTINSLI